MITVTHTQPAVNPDTPPRYGVESAGYGIHHIYINGKKESTYYGDPAGALVYYYQVKEEITAAANRPPADWVTCDCGRTLDAGEDCPDCSIPFDGRPSYVGDNDADDYGLEAVA